MMNRDKRAVSPLHFVCAILIISMMALPNISAMAPWAIQPDMSGLVVKKGPGSLDGLGPEPKYVGNLTGNWVQYNHPTHLSLPEMAFDQMHRDVYVFGGAVGSGSGTCCKENLWKYNIERKQWTDLTTGFRPSGIMAAPMVYDQEGQSLYMFGGEDITQWQVNDLWQYNITNSKWTNIPDGSAPSQRKFAGLTLDSVHRALYLYGGYGGWAFKNDFWRYDIVSRKWTDLTTATTPADGGPSMMFFDDVTQDLILLAAKQYKYDIGSGEWTKVDDNAAKFYNSSMAAYDPATGKVYGLSVHPAYGNDLNVGDGMAGSWSALNSSTPLKNITNGNMVFDSVGNGLFFYGTTQSYSDYYYYDIASDKFTDLGCQCVPDARYRDNMVYDPFNGTVIMYGGGLDSGGSDTRTWEWNITMHSWRTYSLGLLPGGLERIPIEMDTNAKEVYMHRGSGVDSGLIMYNISTHSWANLVTSGSTPKGKSLMGMIYDPTNRSLYNYGGYGSSTYYRNLYRYNTSTKAWTDMGLGGTNPLANPAMVYVKSLDTIFLFGGQQTDVAFSKWMYSYDIKANHWTTLNNGVGPALENQSYANIFYRSKDNSIYIFGGISRSSTSTPFTYHPGFWAYNISTNSWRLENDMMVTKDWAEQRVLYNESTDTMYLYGAKDSMWTGSFDRRDDMSITAAGFVGTDGKFPSGVLHLLYPDAKSSVMVEVNDTKGPGNVNEVDLTLDPAGSALKFKWDRNAGTFTQVSGQNGLMTIDPSSSYLDMSLGRLRVWFNLTTTWNYPDTAAHGMSVKATNKDGKIRTRDMAIGYKMTKAVELAGDLVAQADIHGKLAQGGWVIINEGINWTGPRIVYKGTSMTPTFPVGTTPVVSIKDNDGESWASAAPLSGPMKIRSKADAAEDLNEQYTVYVTGLPQGLSIVNRTYGLHVDGNPVQFHGPTPNNATWFLSSPVEATIQVDDWSGSGVDIDSIQLRTSGDGALSWSNWTAPRKVVVGATCMTAYADVGLKEGKGNRVQWRARDVIGSPMVTSSMLYMYIDSGKVRFLNQSPDPDLPVRTVDKGVVNISVTVKDDVSGVNISTIQYMVSLDGGHSWTQWLAPWDKTTDASGAVSVWASVDLLDQFDMMVKWKAKDLAGNAYNESPVSEVRRSMASVRSDIEVILKGPANGTMVRGGPPVLSWGYTVTNSSDTVDPARIVYSVFLSKDRSLVDGHRSEALVANITKALNLTIDTSSIIRGTKYYWTVVPSYLGHVGTCKQGAWELRLNRYPAIESVPDQWVMVPFSFEATINTSDQDGDPVDLTLDMGPSGMTLAGTHLAWSPSVKDAGTYIVEVTASDGDLQATMEFNLTVLVPQPAVSIRSPTNGNLLRGDIMVEVGLSVAPPGDRMEISKYVEFRLDNGNWVRAQDLNGSVWRGSVLSHNLTDGNHLITARGWAGPVCSKEVSIWFNYDSTKISEPTTKTKKVDLSSYMIAMGVSMAFFFMALALFLFFMIKARRPSSAKKEKKKGKGGPGADGGSGPAASNAQAPTGTPQGPQAASLAGGLKEMTRYPTVKGPSMEVNVQ
jgi:hypothetical protein